MKTIVRYMNGKIIKGYIRNFSPIKSFFHIHPLTGDTTMEGLKIQIRDLKALFFVKDFDGDSTYNERVEISGEPQPNGKTVEVEFTDGEVLFGTVIGYDLKRPGFFLFPTDSQTNNMKVFVVSAAVRKVKYVNSFTFSS